MKLTLFQFVGLIAAGGLGVEATALHAASNHIAHNSQHHRLAHQLDHQARSPRVNSRCSERSAPSSAAVSESVLHSLASAVHTSSVAKPSSSASHQSNPTPPASAPASQIVSGIIDVTSSCGPSGATKEVTATSGPNGDIDWLNCGITSSSGWKPPFVRIDEIITQDLSTAVQDPNSPFQACKAYISLFEQYGAQFGVPGIVLSSFAMQESSCDPNTVGGAGEQGLMQLTADKCVDAPGGNCKDVNYNIKTGAKFFSDTLNSNGGDLLLTIGNYNGWPEHLTIAQATAAADTSCCRCQNNLDYLQQFLNGWCQNVNAYTHSPPLGKYFNLSKCTD